MKGNPALLQVRPGIIVNLDNVAYIEVTGKGAVDIHFAARVKPLHLKAIEAEPVRRYISGENVTVISTAA